MSSVRFLTTSKANVSAVVFVAGTTLGSLLFQADGGVAFLQVYLIFLPLGHCHMLSIPCSGCIAGIDIVCMCAQTDGANRVGSGVCAVGKIPFITLIESVMMRA